MSCDIIIPIWNQLQFTKKCLESIFNYTDYPYRLILVDNNSNNDTKEYLREAWKKDNVILIENSENLGFIKAVNRGIKESDSKYICVMNNDTLATKGWLSELVDILERNPSIAILNPASNNLGIMPKKGESINALSERLKEFKGEWVELNSAIGFCMVFRRELTKLIGLFDEIYGMGNFEDSDYSRSAQSLGLKCAMAKGAYIWHAQNSSFKFLKKYNKSFEENKKIFEKRWGRIERILYVFSFSSANRKIPEKALELLKKGNWVTIFKPEGIVLENIPEHSGLKIKSFSKWGIYTGPLFEILFKKKKFSNIYVENQLFFRILNLLKAVHKGEVFILN